MGKWDRRYIRFPGRSNNRRNYRDDYHWSPPREVCRDPETVVWQDNVPMWEKKFCYLSGISWEKVLVANKFVNTNSPVLGWDDSASKEAFLNAKERFWTKINGLPCEPQLPDPDMYIENVNWYPHIDPELVRDLERSRRELKSISVLRHGLEEHKTTQDNEDNPWETCLNLASQEHEATGCNQWDSCVNGSSELTNEHNPWEYHDKKHNVSVNKAPYGDDWGKSSSWEHLIDSNPSNMSNPRAGPWRQGYLEACSNKPAYQNYSNTGGWKREAPNEWSGSWGQRQWEESRRADRPSLGAMQGSCRKREGSDQYGAGYRGQWFRGGFDHQAGRHWKNVNNNKRVSFSTQ